MFRQARNIVIILPNVNKLLLKRWKQINSVIIEYYIFVYVLLLMNKHWKTIALQLLLLSDAR